MNPTINSKLSSAELCRANGWGCGTILVGDEGRGPEQIRITAVGDDEILAVRNADTDSHFYGEGSWCLRNRDWRETRPVKPMKSTHWSANLDPEDWTDNPSETPEDAAREYIRDYSGDERADEFRHALSSGTTVTVHGFIDTDMSDEAGTFRRERCWYVPTGETVTVVCEINYHVKGTK